MVLGLRNKNRSGPSVQVEYIVHVQEIKPWPPTQSLKTVRSVLIQWENGERNSGSTSSVAPSIEDGKIVFNESFKLSVTLSRDMSAKSGDVYIFHKNLLEFNLYEPRSNKAVKGQLLGTAIVDLAEYGVVRELTSVNAPVNCTRSFRNTAQPILYLRLQAYDKARSGASLKGRLGKETSLDKNDSDSVSALMNEEYADEAEVASFTDDDVSSHSSLTASSVFEPNGASPSQNKENGSGKQKCHSENSELSVGKLAPESCQTQESSKQFSEEDGSLKDQTLAMSISKEDPSITTTIGIPEKQPEKLNCAPAVDFDGVEVIDGNKYEKNDKTGHVLREERQIVGSTSSNKPSLDAVGNQNLSGTGSDSLLLRDRFRHVKSVRSTIDSSKNDLGRSFSGSTLRREANQVEGSTDNKSQGQEHKIKTLEKELREAAALEVALYSVVAEHGSSTNKVHTPARRLSRLYLRAGKGIKRASAAQSSVSGLIVVAKACGNDVPRLTFWLSNCVALRAIISEAFALEELSVSASFLAEGNRIGRGISQKSSTLKWNDSPSHKQAYNVATNGSYLDLEDPHSYMLALEKVESWIFSRVVESVWWQTLTPHMQSSAAQLIDKVVVSGVQKKNKRSSSSADQEQVNFSLELWKKAFKDACERLCPLRAGGHECGCLPVLAKLVMEQCVARLDVAMFNAILRESVDDIPTDPVSDPISDAKVLPVPAGKSSFGSGAQLKNAIGNWSRWLTDLFGMDDDDLPENEVDEANNGSALNYDSSFTSFYLLKSLSDLMMLPKDLLLSESIRREVCPTFGAQVIKRVLEIFVPDEFCSDQIPNNVFEALEDAESTHAESEGLITACPCTAPAVLYYPPPPSSLVSTMGANVETGSSSQLRRSGSLLRRSNTSDDELDELDSPLHVLLNENLQSSPAQMKRNWKVVQNHRNDVMRYQLLREVWDDGEEES